MDELAKLKDIKPPIDIDTSLQELVFYAGAGFGLLLLAIAVVLIYLLIFKKRRRRKRLSPQELALKALKELDYSNTKDAVYNFSVNAQKLANSEQQGELQEILKSLEKYKYKKEVANLEPKDIDRMKKMVEKLRA